MSEKECIVTAMDALDNLKGLLNAATIVCIDGGYKGYKHNPMSYLLSNISDIADEIEIVLLSIRNDQYVENGGNGCDSE